MSASTISNGLLTAVIRHKGAELSSLRHSNSHLEYLWNADPLFWGKSSPVLFPIVGQLRDNEYYHHGRSYTLPRHGFARDMDFAPHHVQRDAATFILESDATTLTRYPFVFALELSYRLEADVLHVSYTVRNRDTEPLWFSLGAHPAFNVPLVSGTSYEDYYLELEHEENVPRWNITDEGLIDKTAEAFLRNERVVPLRKELFDRDALVFKGLKSERMSLLSARHDHGIDFAFTGFPYFGIWAAPGADFVCLEPWCGIADSVTHDKRLEAKEGTQNLAPGGEWNRDWSVRCF